jgi:XTP/dITP diphosphohydrolase
MTVFSATTNPGKLREFREAAAYFESALRIEPLPGIGSLRAPEETGLTFSENAILKAEYYSRESGELVFADDSGLVIDALGGAPGIHSARFAGIGATDRVNNALVLERMSGRTNRRGCFVCSIALARSGVVIRTFDGVVEGEILEQERGAGGFGYDPLFFYPPYGCTLAEVDALRKLDVSHRGQALRAMFAYLSTAGLFPP